MAKFDEDKWEKNIARLMNKKHGDIITVTDFKAMAECLDMLHKTKERFVFR